LHSPVALHWPAGVAQNLPSPHDIGPMPKGLHAIGAGLHSPLLAQFTPMAAAEHALPYVLPSHPQTGSYCSVHAWGSGAHRPLPLHWPSPAVQYWPLAHAVASPTAQPLSTPQAPDFATVTPAMWAMHVLL
jgi:hypothetical protein